MTFPRAVTGFSVVALLALVALAPLPASAGPTVLSTNLVCADVELGYDISIAQNSASGSANLSLTGAGNANLSLTIKASGLPPSTPAACAVLCVVDGIQELFEFEKFKPCGNTTAGGKLTHTATLLDFGGDPFNGGCLLPVPAVWVIPEEPEMGVMGVPSAPPLVVCAPGFGTFLSFPPPCLTDCTN
jgi:hypothetical protein